MASWPACRCFMRCPVDSVSVMSHRAMAFPQGHVLAPGNNDLSVAVYGRITLGTQGQC